MSVSSKSTGAKLLDGWGQWVDAARKAVRPIVPTAAYYRLAGLYNLGLGTHKVGWDTYLRMQRLSSAAANDVAVESFALPMLQHPIWLRPGTPDVHEVLHTIIRANYGRQLPAEPVRLIIDAGAYIGDTTVWYLSRFPEATVIALEPNPRSFALLERNCREYGSRAVLLQAAVWPSRARLEVNRGSDGTTDSSVRLAAGTQGYACDVVTIGDLLDRFGSANNGMVDIFKCDIEGAEVDLFSGPVDEWIERIRTMYVDVHNVQARRIVAEIADWNGFVMHNWRELVILHR